MKDLTVMMKNEPGALANMGEALGDMGINMEGICGLPMGNESIVHVLVEDDTTAQWALEQAGFKVQAVRDVLVLDISNIAGKPGTGGKLARKLGNAGINIDLVYMAENNRIVLGVDDLPRARAVLKIQ
ncbi:MAG: ACT domain-containing protein [Promethearchaeota archaeon]